MHASELRALRHELGLSQSQLAEKMGVTRSTVSRWEMKTGKFPVSHMAANLVRLLAEKKTPVLSVCVLALSILGAGPALATDVYLNLGLGATFFQRTTQNGTWFQEGYPYHMQLRDVAGKIGVGFRTSPEWAFEVNYLSPGQAKSGGQAVPDEYYDPVGKRGLPGSPKPNSFVVRERVQAMEFIALRSWEIDGMRVFLKGGGFLAIHDSPVWAMTGETGNQGTGRYTGYFQGIVGGVGVCYGWVCGEAAYYKGFGSGGYPISKEFIQPMLTVKIPL